MQATQRQCSKCGYMTALYRVEYWNEKKVYVCSKHPKEEKVKEEKASKKVYDDFCRALWKKRKHVSELSGKKLPEYDQHSPRFCNLIRFHMHHYFPKSKHPELMFDENNIVFLTMEEHHIVEWGGDNQREEIGWNKFVQNRNQ